MLKLCHFSGKSGFWLIYCKILKWRYLHSFFFSKKWKKLFWKTNSFRIFEIVFQFLSKLVKSFSPIITTIINMQNLKFCFFSFYRVKKLKNCQFNLNELRLYGPLGDLDHFGIFLGFYDFYGSALPSKYVYFKVITKFRKKVMAEYNAVWETKSVILVPSPPGKWP